MSASANPAPVKRWLASVYPTLHLDPEWLDECLNYLSTHRQDLLGAALLKTVEQQILLSPLEICTTQGSIPQDVPEDGVLSPGKAVLVQIVSMDEVGHSAVHLKETLQAKREDAKLGLEADRVRVQGLTQEGEGEDTQASAGGAAKFPRAMLKLELSDGHTALTALEYRRIPQLDLATTELGSKILLKNAKLRRGVLLLEQDTATVKGGSIQELKEAQDDLLEAQLDARLEVQDAL